MSIKTVLVFLDEAEESQNRLSVACGLAELSGAHVSVLGMTLQNYPAYATGLEGYDTTFDVEEFEDARRRASDLASSARDVLAARKLPGDTRWISREALGLTSIAGRQARHAELVIAGQPVEGPHYTLRESALEGALFRSGRPLLVLPVGWGSELPGKNICIGWDGSKEASRAVHDAIPFIETADKVTIVIVDPVAGSDRFGEEPGADITAVVSRHCAGTELDRLPSSGKPVADVMITRAQDAGADLIVMGGYGHSQLREAIFGGVSRDMIQATTIPLLMSH